MWIVLFLINSDVLYDKNVIWCAKIHIFNYGWSSCPNHSERITYRCVKPKVQVAVNHVITNFPGFWQFNYRPLLVLLTEHCGIKMADEVVSRVLRPRNERAKQVNYHNIWQIIRPSLRFSWERSIHCPERPSHYWTTIEWLGTVFRNWSVCTDSGGGVVGTIRH
jgi:hypothetical protein